MHITIRMHDKPVRVFLSSAAQEALQARETPLVAEMELYFSCLIRTRVRFHAAGNNQDSVSVNEQLLVRFRPVMTLQCGRDYEGDEPPLTDFPIQNSAAFIPKWLRIDFTQNQWTGEFDFTNK